MLNQRRKLLAYLRRSDFNRYAFVLQKLGLKDTYAKQVRGRAMQQCMQYARALAAAIQCCGGMLLACMASRKYARHRHISAEVNYHGVTAAGCIPLQERYDKYRVGSRLGTPAEALKRYGNR